MTEESSQLLISLGKFVAVTISVAVGASGNPKIGHCSLSRFRARLKAQNTLADLNSISRPSIRTLSVLNGYRPFAIKTDFFLAQPSILVGMLRNIWLSTCVAWTQM